MSLRPHVAGEGGRVRPAPAVLALLALLPVTACAAVAGDPASPPRGAFDFRSGLSPGHEASVSARGDFNGDGIPDLVVAGAGGITVFLQGSTSFEWREVRAPGPGRQPIAAIAGRLNGDARDDLLLIFGPKPAVAEIRLSDSRGVPALSSTIELAGEYREGLIADPDGDGDADILLFGKKTLGVAVYAGNGKGAFAAGPLLVPELPVSHAVVAPIDKDDLQDLVVADWLGNNVQVYPGFGGLNYGDPAVIPLDAEPVSLAVGDLNGDRLRDVAAGFADPPGLAIFAGDGNGHFVPAERQPLEAPPELLRIGDIDGDARSDLLIFLPSAASMAIRIQDAAGSLGLPQTYGTGPSPGDVVLFTDARRKALNAAVLSADDGTLRILHARSREAPDPASLAMATGVAPAGLCVQDLNDDGWPDVVLSQEAEPSISVFLNDGRGSLAGQVNMPVPFPPALLTSLATAPGPKDYLATGSGGGSIAYLTLDAASMSAAAVTIRPGAGMFAVGGRRLADGATRRVYAMHDDNPEGRASVYAYDITGRNRSEEAEIHLEFPGRMAAAASCDLDTDARSDIALLSILDTAAAVTFYRQTDEGFEMTRTERFPMGLADEAPPDVLLWIGDLNADGSADIVLNLRKPSNTLAVSLGEADTAFAPPEVVLNGVRIAGSGSLAVTDFDGDGRTDLVFVNDRTRTVQFLPGNGRGGFEGPVNLTGARGVRGFGVGDIDRNGEQELILSNADEGELTVTSFHHPLFGKKRGAGRD